MGKYAISFIIPALNEEKFLPKLLSDIKKQRDKNFEVVVVDGDSEDKTREIAESFSQHFPTKVINAKKRNLSHQRNLGAQMAEGDYLVVIDADSRINNTFTQSLRKEIEKYHYLIFLPTITPQEGTTTDELWFKLINFLTEVSQSVGKPAPSISCMIFERNFFHTLGGYNERGQKDEKTFYPEDHEIILRARKRGVIGKFTDNVKVGFSLRRAQKEGRLSVISKYLRSSYHMMLKGDVKDKLFDYEMGGHVYSNKEKQRNAEINVILKQFKSAFKEILSE